MVDKKFVKVLQGKEFVTHEGLLDEFHKQGGVEITSELVSSEKGVYIFKAIATMQIVNRDKSVITKKFTAHGDANEKNVSTMVVKHLIRMAETRAINRAMRLATNIGMCSVDEMGENKPDIKKPTESGSYGEDVEVSNKCSKCNAGVTDKVKKYSIDKFEKVLCIPCQEKEKIKNEA